MPSRQSPVQAMPDPEAGARPARRGRTARRSSTGSDAGLGLLRDLVRQRLLRAGSSLTCALPAAPVTPAPSRPCRRCSTAASRGSSGPTPPGFGDTQPATSQTSAATSPAILPSTRETPTSRTAAPGLTMSPVMMPGTPAAATTMSALRTCAARSRVPVWQRVTVAFSRAPGQQQPERPADGDPAADDRRPRRRRSGRRGGAAARSRRRGVHGSGAVLAEHQPAEADRVQAVDVLVGVDARRAARTRRARSGQLDEEAGAGGVGVEPSITASTSAWVAVAGRSTRIDSMPTSAQSLCLAPTYQCEPGSSPTRTVPSPGTTPRSRSLATRGLELGLDRLRVAVPSSFCAVMVSSSCQGVSGRSGGCR